MGKKDPGKLGRAGSNVQIGRHSSRSCFIVQGMVDVFVNKCSRLVSFPTSIGTVKPVSVTVYRPATDIPEEGLLLYPVAVRAPTGHGDARGTNDVELKPTLLSHPTGSKHSGGDAGLLPHHIQQKLEEGFGKKV